jgi:geranylgeranyl pyrophosphate synthase
MVSELAQASGVAGMCGGQALDLEAEGQQVICRRWSVSIATKRAR